MHIQTQSTSLQPLSLEDLLAVVGGNAETDVAQETTQETTEDPTKNTAYSNEPGTGDRDIG